MSVYDLPTNRAQKAAIAIELVFCILALLVMCMRIYVRQKLKTLGSDDVLVSIAMILSMALCVTSIFFIRYMFIGLPAKDIPDNPDSETAFKWGYAMGVVYNPILALTKLSVLIFILRFSGVVSGIRYLTWTIFVFSTCQMVAMFIVVVFECVPFAKNWDSTLPGQCVDTWSYSIATSTITIITDLVCVALPLHILAGLNMSRRHKLSLAFVLGLGIVTTAFSCIRLYFLYQTFHSTNPDDATSITFTFSAIEANLAIITASTPGIWPLVSGQMGVGSRARDYQHAAYGRSRRSSGWIKTNDSAVSAQQHVDADIGLNDVEDETNTQMYRGTSLSGSKDEILPWSKQDGYVVRSNDSSRLYNSR